MSSGSPQPDNPSSFDAMMGWVRSGVAASIFIALTYYAFFQVPKERQESRDHGGSMMRQVMDEHRAESKARNDKLTALFNRMLDQQKTSVSIARGNAEIQKQILAAQSPPQMELVEPKPLKASK